MRILSFGSGVDSSAIAVYHVFEKSLGIDAAVFADTGAEHPDTYRNVQVFKELLESNGIPFYIVSKDGETITEWCTRLGVVPLMPGGSHVCSKKFKGDVIAKWAKREGIENPTYLIGIEANEGRRVKRFTAPKGDQARYEYPLVDLDLDREDCENLLAIHGFEVRKSSCMFCPFMSAPEIEEALSDPHAEQVIQLVESRFQEMSAKKHQAWVDAGKPLNKGGRAPKGMWRKDSWAEGQRLFVKKNKGKMLSVPEWKEFFRKKREAV